MHPTVPTALAALAKRLQSPLYVVGGYVRNALLWGRDGGTDVDICGPLTVAQLSAAIANADVEIVPVNPRVGTVLVRYAGERYEYTTFRRDSYPSGGVHTPQSVTFVQTVQEDALRRDFTINAVYLDCHTGALVDPTGGLEDLAHGLVRTTRAPEAVFGEDGLRILRLVRFCAELGFAPEAQTLAVAKAQCGLLADISAERKREELDKILLADVKYGVPNAFEAGLRLADEVGIWPYMGAAAARGVAQQLQGLPPLHLTRLAGLCMALGAADGEAASRLLGQDGLRYPNAVVRGVRRYLEGLYRPDSEVGWRLWAAEYGGEIEGIAPLWHDPLDAERAKAAWRAIRRAAVPLTHKDLPLAPGEIEAMGVPRYALGHTMQAICRHCAAWLLCPTREEAVAIVEQIKGENRWKP